MPKIIFYHMIDPVTCRIMNIEHRSDMSAIVLKLEIAGIENGNKFLKQIQETRENSIITRTFFVTDDKYTKIAWDCMITNISIEHFPEYGYDKMITVKCVGETDPNMYFNNARTISYI